MICPKCKIHELKVIDLYTKEKPNVWYGNSLGCSHCYSLLTAKEMFEMYEFEKARAEKAEGELKAIKARIEAVTEETIKQKIYDNAYKGIDNNDEAIWCFDNYDFNTFLKNILEIIKQIGGEK